MQNKIFTKTAIAILLLFTNLAFAQTTPPAIQWKKCYGSGWGDIAHDIHQTFDGGYIVAGETSTIDNSGDVTNPYGGTDFWIVKLSATGAIEWQKCYGGSGTDIANSIIQTKDSGYIVCGSTTSGDGDVTGFTPDPNFPLWGDYWIIKINKTGVLQWQKTLGGGKFNRAIAYSIILTNDNGCLVSGYNSNGSTVDFANGTIIKLSEAGAIQWQGQDYNGLDYSAKQTTDNGYILCGGRVFSLGIQKSDSLGNRQWEYSYGGVAYSNNMLFSILQTADGGYIAVGSVDSTDTIIKGNHGGVDVVIIKVDSAGTKQWHKCYGGTKDDVGYSIQPTFDGGFIIAGKSASSDGDVLNVNPAILPSYGPMGFHSNLWMFKINGTGTLLWQKTMGGKDYDDASAIQPTTDSGYIVAGNVVSGVLPDGDADIKGTGYLVNTFSNRYEFFIVKFAKEAKTVPVVLTNFTATVFNKNAQLNWTTNNEINNQSFDIERSSDGINFETISKINANSTFTSIHQYNYTDINFYNFKLAYYRLKQVDIDGGFNYSKIVVLTTLADPLSEIIVSPNPAKSFFTINLPTSVKNVQLLIFDEKENLIEQKTGIGGCNTISTKNLSNGVYIVKAIYNNKIVSKKIVVLK